MNIRESTIIDEGVVVAWNRKPECGHFYLYGGQIYRAMPDRDESVYPICTKHELQKMIDRGTILPPTAAEPQRYSLPAWLQPKKLINRGIEQHRMRSGPAA